MSAERLRERETRKTNINSVFGKLEKLTELGGGKRRKIKGKWYLL